MVKKSQRTAAVNNQTISLNENFSDQNRRNAAPGVDRESSAIRSII